jgi:excinuclease ABC subunit B
MDNRPLKFEEFFRRINNTIFVSATPNDFEISISKQSAYSYKDKPPNTIIEQLVRPTGIVDPQVIIKPTKGQINDLINEIMIRKKNNERVLVTTLTKKIAEDLSIYLNNPENYKEYMDNFNNKIDLPKINYLHSEITTLKRTAILNDLRSGIYDVVVGINLLREGIDLPEVTLVAILDADKEGFLRSKTSLIQTMGRAARNDKSMIIMYADIITKSMLEAIEEIKRRRDYQIKYNKKFKITPKKIIKPLRDNLSDLQISNDKQNYMNIDKIKDYQKVLEIDYEQYIPLEKQRLTVKLTKMMKQAATELNFELASVLRDKIDEIKKSI